jgi:hypothetical protein
VYFLSLHVHRPILLASITADAAIPHLLFQSRRKAELAFTFHGGCPLLGVTTQPGRHSILLDICTIMTTTSLPPSTSPIVSSHRSLTAHTCLGQLARVKHRIDGFHEPSTARAPCSSPLLAVIQTIPIPHRRCSRRFRLHGAMALVYIRTLPAFVTCTRCSYDPLVDCCSFTMYYIIWS